MISRLLKLFTRHRLAIGGLSLMTVFALTVISDFESIHPLQLKSAGAGALTRGANTLHEIADTLDLHGDSYWQIVGSDWEIARTNDRNRPASVPISETDLQKPIEISEDEARLIDSLSQLNPVVRSISDGMEQWTISLEPLAINLLVANKRNQQWIVEATLALSAGHSESPAWRIRRGESNSLDGNDSILPLPSGARVVITKRNSDNVIAQLCLGCFLTSDYAALLRNKSLGVREIPNNSNSRILIVESATGPVTLREIVAGKGIAILSRLESH